MSAHELMAGGGNSEDSLTETETDEPVAIVDRRGSRRDSIVSSSVELQRNIDQADGSTGKRTVTPDDISVIIEKSLTDVDTSSTILEKVIGELDKIRADYTELLQRRRVYKQFLSWASEIMKLKADLASKFQDAMNHCDDVAMVPIISHVNDSVDQKIWGLLSTHATIEAMTRTKIGQCEEDIRSYVSKQTNFIKDILKQEDINFIENDAVSDDFQAVCENISKAKSLTVHDTSTAHAGLSRVKRKANRSDEQSRVDESQEWIDADESPPIISSAANTAKKRPKLNSNSILANLSAVKSRASVVEITDEVENKSVTSLRQDTISDDDDIFVLKTPVDDTGSVTTTYSTRASRRASLVK